jgi:hypothetical protein
VLTVTTLLDNVAGSLRAEVLLAQDGDTVQFADGLRGQVTLTTGPINVDHSIDIAGPGLDVITVSGNHAGRIFNVPADQTASISDLTIKDGQVADQGGAIDNLGTLTVRGCILSGNSAAGNLGGGAIHNGGTLTVRASTLSGNSAGWLGGGIYNNGTLAIGDSSISGNSSVGGSGIYIQNATMTITGSTLTGNSTTGEGGGIFSVESSLTVSNSTLSGNTAAALGGGIAYDDTRAGYVSIFTNVTITGNRDNTGNSSNTGGGISVTSPTISLPVLHNALIADNFNRSTGTNRDDVSGRLGGGSDYNLIGDGNNMSGITNGVNGNQVGTHSNPIDPRLGALGYDGGPTQTVPLLADRQCHHYGRRSGPGSRSAPAERRRPGYGPHQRPEPWRPARPGSGQRGSVLRLATPGGFRVLLGTETRPRSRKRAVGAGLAPRAKPAVSLSHSPGEAVLCRCSSCLACLVREGIWDNRRWEFLNSGLGERPRPPPRSRRHPPSLFRCRRGASPSPARSRKRPRLRADGAGQRAACRHGGSGA